MSLNASLLGRVCVCVCARALCVGKVKDCASVCVSVRERECVWSRDNKEIS
uniref:Uncharacterized protein n=1 Tax=Anguilla anguilla TaxID=7936 RepID=A0A0E9TXR5_ANGAN